MLTRQSEQLPCLVQAAGQRFIDIGRQPAPQRRCGVFHVAVTIDRQHHDAVDGVYVCGPEPMLVAARELLLERGVDPAKLHEERFSAPQRRGSAPARGSVAAPVTIRRRGRPAGEGAVVIVPAGATLLEAATAAGQDMPFSCAVGGCGACRVRVLEGEVVMDEPNCLSEEERAAGYALTCCGAPVGPCAIEVE